MIQRETSATDARRHRRTDGPVRTCVGCRKRELAVELLRVVAVSTGNGEYAVIVDPAGSLPGGVHGCIPTRNARGKRSGGELSPERCASPVHRTPPRWSSTWNL
ncbi:hypothetical protein I553_7485 [Mycobacterium xenopi 4042]|uniref:YlxR domain-containing protein n=1 Tax=Mycobacterium xenopi 4042 TaxID=1299334 RepID=X8E8C6_MYCXE|nr:hypothetical protein I553_7485 [Mycobacterium xenopi 4042]